MPPPHGVTRRHGGAESPGHVVGGARVGLSSGHCGSGDCVVTVTSSSIVSVLSAY